MNYWTARQVPNIHCYLKKVALNIVSHTDFLYPLISLEDGSLEWACRRTDVSRIKCAGCSPQLYQLRVLILFPTFFFSFSVCQDIGPAFLPPMNSSSISSSCCLFDAPPEAKGREREDSNWGSYPEWGAVGMGALQGARFLTS